MNEKITFISQGAVLNGKLERPDNKPIAYALFAHCFTCGMDVVAASRISAALTKQGIAVLRFNFRGLGASEGNFSSTNFSTNLQDLIAASEFLRENYEAPQILIGHSLGGAAVLGMADKVPEAKAVVTIGSPASADHVAHNFEQSLDEINANGEAEVQLGFRTFNIQKQFIDDLEDYQHADYSTLNKALLVMHSPIDKTVNIAQAQQIYQGANHPKSFISLHKADHLLTSKQDAIYVANMISTWVSQYVELTNEDDISYPTQTALAL